MKRPLGVVVSSFALASLALPAHADEGRAALTELSATIALAPEVHAGPTRVPLRDVQTVASKHASFVFDWVSPVFVWVEVGYAYLETSFSF